MGSFITKIFQNLNRLWSITEFSQTELSYYAERYIKEEVRRGITILGLVSLILLAAAAFLYSSLGFGEAYIYTFGMVAILALHITISTRGTRSTQMLYMLGITLLIIAGTAFVLLAHKTGNFSSALLSSTVILFMLIPLVTWGMREAMLIVCLIYLVFTLSSVSVEGRFDKESLWLLQFLMLGSSAIALTVVARNVAIRKQDIVSHYELEKAHREMEKLSYKDPLTGSWNRRYLELKFKDIVNDYKNKSIPFQFALIDLNKFKFLNDEYGHDFGDMVLQIVAKAFMKESNDFLVRMGGDEFLVITSHDNSDNYWNTAISYIEKNAALQCREDVVHAYISVGVVCVNQEHEVYLDVLYRQADAMLYKAKSISQNDNDQSHVEFLEYGDHIDETLTSAGSS